MTEIIVATIFLLLAIAVGIVKLIRIDGGIYLQDVRLFFLLSFSLYTAFLPVVYCFFPDIFVFKTNVFTNMVWLYFSAVLAYDIVLFKYSIAWGNRSLTKLNRKKNFTFIILALVALVLYSYYYMHSQGVTTFALGEEMDDRGTYAKAIHQSWIILTIVVAVFFNYLLFHYKYLTRKFKFILLGCLAFYILYQMSLGNRREYVTMALFLVCYYLSSKQKPLNIKLLILLLVGFIGSFAITIVRDPNTRDLSLSQKVQISILSNEFVYPQQTTYYTMDSEVPYKWGYTYTLLPIQVAIPRSIYPEKPRTLGSEFVTDILGSTQGYAYTPVTEAYINFGYIGPFIIFYIISVFLNKQVVQANRNGVSFKYMMIYAYIFDFCRGEFSSIMYSLMIIYFTYVFIRYFSKNYRLKFIV